MIISYSDFAKLRMRNFWPAPFSANAVSGITCELGYGDGEAIGWSYFLWPPRFRGEVSEVRLESIPSAECSTETAQAVISAIGLSLRPGDTSKAVVSKLGPPVNRRRTGINEFLDFVVGNVEKYVVMCGFTDDEGLRDLTVVREDRQTDG